MRPQAISVGDANAVHFLLALTSGGSQQLAASEQESGDRVRVEGSYRRRHSKGWRTEEPGDVLILSAPCIVKPPPSPGAKFSQGRSGSPAIGTHRSSRRRRLSRSRLPRPGSTCSQSTAQQPASTSARRSSNHHPIHIAMVPYKSTPDEVEVELAMKTGGRWPAARSTLHVEARLLNRRRRRCHEVIEAQPDGAGAAHLSPAAAPTSMLKHGATRPALHVQAGAEDDGAITKTPREEATSSRCRRREDAEA